MSTFEITKYIIAIASAFLIAAFAISRNTFKKNSITLKVITRSGIFAAFSIILYIIPPLKPSLPIFPSFLELHFDEIPAFIAGFAYGPISAFLVILIKTIVKLPMTNTACVGELADFIYSIFFVLPACIIYRKRKGVKNVIMSFGISTLIQLVVSCFLTTFVMLDFYISFYGMPAEAILAMCQAINPLITDLKWPFLFMVALPFNALKDVLVALVTILIYKRLHKIIDKFAQKN